VTISPTVILTVILTAVVMVVLAILVNNFIPTERKIKHHLPHHYGIADAQFGRAIGQLLGPPILDGNTVEILENGVRIFPAMREAIAGASRAVTLESYIWTEGKVADDFSSQLAECARRGLKVHVLLDAAGCGLSDGPTMQRMKEAGVEVEVYHLSNLARFNFRTHRKLLVIDGTVGFIGGVGFADQWQGDADKADHWRDTHFRVTGPVVAQLQAAFNDNWMKARARVLDGAAYFPELQPTGGVMCQIFKSSPQEGSESARLMFLLSLAAAEHSIRIGNAYFIPDDLTVETMLQARQRGVEIEVIIPGDHQDSAMVRRACRERSGRLLAAGVRIFEFQPTMYHCKCLIIDDYFCSVGSSNFDNRSFRLNDEANLNILDRTVAAGLLEQFGKDSAASREVTYGEWQGRSIACKIADKFCALLRSQI
jgi:cardiolipin synthase